MLPSRYTMARWITSDNPKALRKFMDANAAHIAYDVVDAAAFLIGSRSCAWPRNCIRM